MRINKNKSGMLDCYIFASYPIMALYKFLPGISIGTVGLLIIILLQCFKKKVRLNYTIILLMMVLIGINLATGILNYIDFSSTLKNTSNMFLFLILMGFLCNNKIFNEKKLYEALSNVGILSTIVIFIQVIGYYFGGKVIEGNIPYLKPIQDGFHSISYGRPTSFFYEPAHYIIYVLPIYYIALVKKEKKKIIFFFIGIILSTSATGIFCSLLLPAFNSMKGSFFKLKKRRFFLIIIIVVCLVIFSQLEYFDRFFKKLTFEYFLKSARIFGGFHYFELFDLKNWFGGVGFNRLKEYAENKNNFSLAASNYSNSILYVFLSFGLFGGIAWINYILSLHKKLNKKTKGLWLILILISLTDQILFNRNLIYILIMIHIYKNKNIKRSNNYFSKRRRENERFSYDN